MSADDTARENDSQHKAREVRDLAIRELDMLLDQQAELRRRIRGVRKLILALATSFEHCAPPEGFHARKVTRLPQRDRALTEACRIALSGSDLPLTLDQIRDRLRFQGLEFEQPRDPMMSITRVLKRLVRLWHCPRCGAAMIVVQRFTAAELSTCAYFDSS